MKRIALALMAATILPWGAATSETPTLDTVRASLEAAWKPVEFFTSDASMDFEFPVGTEALPLTGHGALKYLKEKGKERYRFILLTKVPEPYPMEMKTEVVYIDDSVYLTVEIQGQAQRQKGKPSLALNALPPGGEALIKALEAELALTVLPDGEVDGAPVFIIEGRPLDPAMPFSKALFYLDKKLGVQRKSEIYDPEGKVGITLTFRNFQTTERPESGLFTAPF